MRVGSSITYEPSLSLYKIPRCPQCQAANPMDLPRCEQCGASAPDRTDHQTLLEPDTALTARVAPWYAIVMLQIGAWLRGLAKRIEG